MKPYIQFSSVQLFNFTILSTAWEPCATLISPHLLHYHVRHKRQTSCVRATCCSSSVVTAFCQQVFSTPFDFRDHGDESQDAKVCKLQEVWSTSKGPVCEILYALFCGQRKAERQKFLWELKRQPRERGELKRQSTERGELKRQSRERGELKRKWHSKKCGELTRQSRERGEREEG